MNDYLIIYFRPYKYRFNDEIRFELNNFPKTIDIKCVEVFDYLYLNKGIIYFNSPSTRKNSLIFLNMY